MVGEGLLQQMPLLAAAEQLHSLQELLKTASMPTTTTSSSSSSNPSDGSTGSTLQCSGGFIVALTYSRWIPQQQICSCCARTSTYRRLASLTQLQLQLNQVVALQQTVQGMLQMLPLPSGCCSKRS
jgi:hypothetical protein